MFPFIRLKTRVRWLLLLLLRLTRLFQYILKLDPLVGFGIISGALYQPVIND